MSVKLMLVDDQTLFREGLKLLLETDKNYEVVSEAADTVECLENLDELNIDILITDFNMPDFNGLDLLIQTKKKYPKVKVIILTTSKNSDNMARALDNGADGYISKSVDFEELCVCIKKVLDGEIYYQDIFDSAYKKLIDHRNYDKEKINELTKREIEILKQIAGGRFNKEIAESLDITERTVKNHISNLFKKIDVNDRTQAAVFAIRNNLVNLY